ncbi:MAG: hypothetical protein JTT11_09545 [Candidatus Brockarchaeota archaeon]|nr:hypothetical protein [Candidatus Brockarchaeota archaeon]
MESRERVVRALELEEPDTVPTFEMIIDPVETVRSILGREPVYGNAKLLLEIQMGGSVSKEKAERINRQWVVDQYELYSKLDLDMIRFWEWRFVPAKSVEKVSEEEWVIDGIRHAFKGGTLWRRDPIGGAVSKGPGAVLEWLREHGNESIEAARNAQFPGLRYAKKINEGGKFMLVDVGCIWGVEEITGFEEFPTYLPWYHSHPEVVERMHAFMAEVVIERAKAAIDNGADGILTCEDFGYSNKTWVSPPHFRLFIYPGLKRVADAVKRRGSFYVVHSDGNNEPLLEMLAEAGIDGYQSIDILGGMDLAEVKRRIGDKVCLLGNVDLRVLGSGSAEDVKREVERCIESAAWGGGYVICSSGSMLESTPDNLRAMVAHARKVGRYAMPG